jgi:hypothetical protein
MQQEQSDSVQPQSSSISTELWRQKDVAAFVEALHSIRARAPNGGFKAPHFREAGQRLAQEVPDGMPKTADQLSHKYQEVHTSILCFVQTEQS